MIARNWIAQVVVALTAPLVTVASVAPVAAQSPAADKGSSPVLRLTLEETKQRILADSNLLQLAGRNVQSKCYAAKAAAALYYPQVIGNSVYFRFNDDLGSIITTPGKLLAPRSVGIPLVDKNSSLTTINAVQPLTDLLKVRQGVKIAKADQGIAQAQLDKGARELASGAEQLFWGLLTVQKLRAGAQLAVAGTEPLAKTGNLEARTALIKAKQGLQEAANQEADLEEQLAILLGMPTSTKFELVEPALPASPVNSAEEAVALALQSSPEIREASHTICKAQAAAAAGKLDYVPSVALVGGYANNNMFDVVQPNFGYVGVVGSMTFIDWGKRRNTIHERNEFVAMANLKLRATQDEVRQNALKAFREYESTGEALKLSGEMIAARTETAQQATDMAAKFAAAKNQMEAQVDAAKADLAHRIAFVKLMSLIGKN